MFGRKQGWDDGGRTGGWEGDVTGVEGWHMVWRRGDCVQGQVGRRERQRREE